MSEKARLQLRIPEELKKQMQEYCMRKNTNMSSLVIRFFNRLLELEDSEADADQF